jgi:hypothetical protein
VSRQDAQPDFSTALRPLKDFQRRTVDYAFQQLYQQPGTGRFLVADEVGLGKTLVARGVVAKTIEHLWESVPRIDIIYICSNADIARQNIARLTIPGLNQFMPADRITLLPISTRQRNGRNFKDERVNFVPLTPGTSFKMFSQFGVIEERILLYRLLQQLVEMPVDGAMHVFAGSANKRRFRHQYLDDFDRRYEIDPILRDAFLEKLAKPDNRQLQDRVVELCRLFQQSRKEVRQANRQRHLAAISDLRDLLARTCIAALEPDLVIMDEFQRFKHLLRDDNDAGQLAQALFGYPGVRILLLSATPYKMYTLDDESEREDHYDDFLATLRFLYADEAIGDTFRRLLTDYRQALLQYGNREAGGRDYQPLWAAKAAVEAELRQVMTRTEKLTASADRNGMFREINSGVTLLEPQDLTAYVGLQQVSELLKHTNTLEYWKSAPYLLNFMEEYKLKRSFQNAVTIQEKKRQLANILALTPHMLISSQDIEQYKTVDPGNARLRHLVQDVIEPGAWQLLWIPPTLPYYRLQRPFDDEQIRQFTKRLVFSAWHVVPKVVASLLSYEAERRIMLRFDPTARNTTEERTNRRGLLRIARSEGRLTGLPVLGLMYPSPTLAGLGDPLSYYSRNSAKSLPDPTALLSEIQEEVETRLAALPIAPVSEGIADEAWYWAAPILLDHQADPAATAAWWHIEKLPALWSGEEAAGGEEPSAWEKHIAYVHELLAGGDPAATLGRPPDNLSSVLAQMALGAPGNVALRALSRVVNGHEGLVDPQLRLDAAAVGWAFRSLFNTPEAITLVRGHYQSSGLPYWQQLLGYTIAGCLQSVLDEYAHLLRESVGLVDESGDGVSTAVSNAMRSSIHLRTASLRADDIRFDRETGEVDLLPPGFRVNSHFAQRFGDIHSDSDKTLTRKGAVREAFNSPFWPFVLVTTSVGQEGLDFHQYCHAVVHWNLPANPVDLEQREGRVHRFKGHAIRKNVAHDYGRAVQLVETTDPWREMFAAAHKDNGSDLVPFWIYPETGDAQAYIERYVPAPPLSRDAHQLVSLRKALTIYRMVFGQNRQEDLVTYLLNRLTEEEIDQLMNRLQIDLRPPKIG